MQLSVSNLAWPVEETDWCLEQLAKYNIQGVELAPLKVFESWKAITDESIQLVKGKYSKLGLEISSFQAITFGAMNLALLGGDEKVDNFLLHIEKVANLLSKLNGDNAVFGSPGLRKNSEYEQKDLIFLFKRIDTIFAKYKTNFVLETVPQYYGCNLLNTIKKTDTFLNNMDLKNVSRHFDSGCQFLSGDLTEKSQYIDFLSKSKHVHISEVDLNTFDFPSTYNVEIASIVKEHYKGRWCVLEMSDKNYTRLSFLNSLCNFSNLFSN